MTRTRTGVRMSNPAAASQSPRICSRIDCTGSPTYHYGHGAGPHAVTQVDSADGVRTFVYDANGNMTHDRLDGQLQRQFVYTPFNKLRSVIQHTGSARTSDFHYGPDRSRFLQIKRDGSGIVSRTHYIGNVEYEYEQDSFVLGQLRRDIGGIAMEDLDIMGRGKLRYQHRDHLGSIVALSTAGGRIHARMGFDPWGQRREPVTAAAWRQWLTPATSIWMNTA